MKKFLLLILLLISFAILAVSQCSQQDSIKYKRAYCYITNDSIMHGKAIEISERLTNTFYVFFSECFKKENESKFELMQRLYNKDMNNESINNKKPCINREYIHSKCIKNHSRMFLEFSKIEGNDLFVSVRTMLLTDPLFEQTYYYYFCFDNNGNILNVFKKMMHGL
jgi:hypothetical protein